MSKVWFVTRSSRGLGLNIVKAALVAGQKVVATARNASAVTKALGEQENLLADKAQCVRATFGISIDSKELQLP